MRGLGSLFRQRNSRFWWMQYFTDGQRHRESTNRERQSDARDVLRNKILEIQKQRELEARDGAPATIAELYAGLERDYLINGRKSLKHLRFYWSKHLAPVFAAMTSNKVTSEHVALYIRRRQDQGAANASINRELAALKRMHKLAVQAGRIKTIPHIATLKERNVRKGFVRDAVYESLARATADVGLWLRSMFELGYTYGWRKAELVEMRVHQVDLAAGAIELNPGETKNDEGRTVQMTAKVRELLEQCVQGKTPDDRVFTRADGARVGDFRRTWSTATAAAGVAGLLFHDLRRTGVRNMRRLGIPERVAMKISGHKTRSVFERYNIIDPSDLQEATAKLEQGAVRRAAAEPGSGNPAESTP